MGGCESASTGASTGASAIASPSEFKGVTGVYDMKTGHVHEGIHRPSGNATAHEQLVRSTGLKREHCRGYSVKPNESMGWNSGTLNPERTLKDFSVKRDIIRGHAEKYGDQRVRDASKSTC